MSLALITLVSSYLLYEIDDLKESTHIWYITSAISVIVSVISLALGIRMI